MIKICTKCNKEKSMDGFYWEKRYNRPRASCKDCGNKQKRLKYASNPTSYRPAIRNSNYLRLYGISLSEFDLMREKQNYRCKICGVNEDQLTKRFCVDHCNKTKIVRGLLCGNCNQALGKLKDSTELLQTAIRYLDTFGNF